jgi:hypothetical protein
MRAPAILLLLLSTQVLPAQTVAPALLVNEGNAAAPLRLARVDVEARLLSPLAETKMTMTFANDQRRQLEGDLYFPLPEGATVCGYALDVNGKMVDGVVVDKEQGQQAYEAIVRRVKDPGLLELVEGNTFRARVFPIPPEGTRTIAIRYVTDLPADAGGPTYELPLNFKEKVGEFHLRVEAVRAEAPPKILKGGWANFAFAKQDGGFVAETTLKDTALTETLAVALPPRADRVVVVEKARDGRTYFCLSNLLPPEALPGKGPAAEPKRITILWDGSGSRGGKDHAREIRLLASYLASLKRGPVAVDLIVFRHEAARPQHFTVEDGRADALLKVLEAVDYDGGTQLAAISPAAGAEPPDLYLLFTDGWSTFGKDVPERLGAPVYVFYAGGTANRSVLANLCLLNGGAGFNLARMRGEEVLAGIGRPRCRFLGTEVTAGRITDLSPTKMQPASGRMTLVGSLEGDEAAVTVKYGWTDRDQREVKVKIAARGPPEGGLLQFVWARNKVADLMAGPEPDAKEIARIGKQYGVITPYTSLIVLENVGQYLEFRIRPPAMLPEMRKQYDEAVAREWFAEKGLPIKTAPQAERLYDLLVPWYFRISLWEEEHPFPPGFRYNPADKALVAPGGVASRFMVRMCESGGSAGGRFTRGFFGAAGGGAGGGNLFGTSVDGGASERAGSRFSRPADTLGPPQFEVSTVTQRATAAAIRQSVQDLAPTFGESPTPLLPPGGPVDITATPHPRAPVDFGEVMLPPDPEEDRPLWDPETSYLRTLAAAPPESVWAAYMVERTTHAKSAAFFIDCADFFLRRGERDRGLQVLSNLAELNLAGPLRTMAYRLLQLGMPDLATTALEEEIRMEPEETASFYDLAMVLADQGKFERAAELLHKLLTADWSDRFMGADVTALADLNRLIPKLDSAAVRRLGLDRRLIRVLDADLRVTVTWDASWTDVDLAVIEPSGEKCFYDHAATTTGGELWLDFENGCGPEEYVLRRAMEGVYKVQVSCASTGGPRLLPVMVRADVFTNFGRPGETHEVFVVPLAQEGSSVTVKEITFRRGPGTEAPGAGR